MESNNTYRCAGANRLKRISTTVSVGSTCFRVKIALKQCLTFMLVVGGALSGTLAETAKTPGTGTTTESVVALLNADGTLNLHTGFRGTLSAEGWTMVTDASGRPRFIRAGESGARPASRAAISRHSGGNGAWDDRFSFPGVEGEVYAIAVSGGDVYFGGAFSSAGGIPSRNIARWDGQNWFALGPGVDGPVYAIAVNGEVDWKNDDSTTHVIKFDSGTTCGFTSAGDKSHKNPKLGPLASNVGLTKTIALLTGLSSSVRAADSPDANAILDRAIQALGGEDKLSKVTAVSWTLSGSCSPRSPCSAAIAPSARSQSSRRRSRAGRAQSA